MAAVGAAVGAGGGLGQRRRDGPPRVQRLRLAGAAAVPDRPRPRLLLLLLGCCRLRLRLRRPRLLLELHLLRRGHLRQQPVHLVVRPARLHLLAARLEVLRKVPPRRLGVTRRPARDEPLPHAAGAAAVGARAAPKMRAPLLPRHDARGGRPVQHGQGLPRGEPAPVLGALSLGGLLLGFGGGGGGGV